MVEGSLSMVVDELLVKDEWTKTRNLSNIAQKFKEEMEEVLTALENEDVENLKEELGDLLFHIVLTSKICEKDGCFTLKEVEQGITNKMIKRHL